jgi:hypothetical protein
MISIMALFTALNGIKPNEQVFQVVIIYEYLEAHNIIQIPPQCQTGIGAGSSGSWKAAVKLISTKARRRWPKVAIRGWRRRIISLWGR